MNIDRAVRDIVDRHGEPATLTNYTQTGTDNYGDPTFSETSSSAEIIVDTPEPTSNRDAAGIDEMTTVILRIPTTYDVREADADTVKPTVITRDNTGETYRVQTKVDTGDGLYKCTVDD